MDSQTWHERFAVQAEWTKSLRDFLYGQTGINNQSRILEVGCGTGVIIDDLRQYKHHPSFGIDHNLEHLLEGYKRFPDPYLTCSEAAELPYPGNTFNDVISHFFFLWNKEPVLILKEILRVLKPGGLLISLAEPDYLARIDSPQEFWELAELQTRSLIRQGVNPMAGRQLPQLLNQAGFINVQFGVSGFQSESQKIPEWFESEWKVLQHDLQDSVSSEKLKYFRKLDIATRKLGSRVLWVPTFYAFGQKNY